MKFCDTDIQAILVCSYIYMHLFHDNAQSTLRSPEVSMFYRKIIICIAYMRVDHVHTSCSVAKRNDSVCNTVTLIASKSTK